jgi:hypothetical protein
MAKSRGGGGGGLPWEKNCERICGENFEKKPYHDYVYHICIVIHVTLKN